MSYRVHDWLPLAQQLCVQFPKIQTIYEPLFLNATYCSVTRDWVNGPFSKYFFDYLAARGDLKWRKRGNQCEHFALRAALEAVYLFGQSTDSEIPSEAESIAVAAVAYRRRDGVMHEVNLWYIGGIWQPWEPQTMSFFDFTESECFSVEKPLVP